MKLSELSTHVKDLNAQLTKLSAEIDAKLNGPDISDDIVIALTNLTQAVQVLDDITPDASPPQVPPGTKL